MVEKQEVNVTALRTKLKDQVELELEKQLRAIPKTVEHVVENAIIGIIGVRRMGNGYDVDTFSKREEALNGFIKRKTAEKIEEIVGPVVDAELRRLMGLITLKRQIIDRCQSGLQHDFERAFRDRVKEKFAQLGRKLGDQFSDEIDGMLEDVATFNDDVLDPDSFEGRIGSLFLEEIAKQTTDDMEK